MASNAKFCLARCNNQLPSSFVLFVYICSFLYQKPHNFNLMRMHGHMQRGRSILKYRHIRQIIHHKLFHYYVCNNNKLKTAKLLFFKQFSLVLFLLVNPFMSGFLRMPLSFSFTCHSSVAVFSLYFSVVIHCIICFIFWSP